MLGKIDKPQPEQRLSVQKETFVPGDNSVPPG